MAGTLSVAELSVRTSAIESSSDDRLARADAGALFEPLRAATLTDIAALKKARQDFNDRHFGYSRYWASSRAELARDVTPLEQKVDSEVTTLARLSKVIERATQRLEQQKLHAITERLGSITPREVLSFDDAALIAGSGVDLNAATTEHDSLWRHATTSENIVLTLTRLQSPTFDPVAIADNSLAVAWRAHATVEAAALFASTRELSGGDAEAIYTTLAHHRWSRNADALIASAIATTHGTPEQAKHVQAVICAAPGLCNLNGALLGSGAVRAGVEPSLAIGAYHDLLVARPELGRDDAALLTYVSVVSGKPIGEVLGVRDFFAKDPATRQATGQQLCLLTAGWAFDGVGRRAEIIPVASYHSMVDSELA